MTKKPLPNSKPFDRSIASKRITGAIQAVMIPLLVFSLLVMPVAAKQPAVTTQSGNAGGLCQGSNGNQSMFAYWINKIIQLSIYGGVALGGAMYIGAEAIDSRGFLGEQTVEKVKNMKRSGLGKIVKLSLIPTILAVLVQNSSAPFANCITLVPF